MGSDFYSIGGDKIIQSTLNKKNKQIREQKKLILELAKGICKYLPSNPKSQEANDLLDNACKIVIKQTKKKK